MNLESQKRSFSRSEKVGKWRKSRREEERWTSSLVWRQVAEIMSPVMIFGTKALPLVWYCFFFVYINSTVKAGHQKQRRLWSSSFVSLIVPELDRPHRSWLGNWPLFPPKSGNKKLCIEDNKTLCVAPTRAVRRGVPTWLTAAARRRLRQPTSLSRAQLSAAREIRGNNRQSGTTGGLSLKMIWKLCASARIWLFQSKLSVGIK